MNSRFLTYRISALALALAAGPALVAQVTTGGLAGSVKTKDGAPLAAVKVIISSPALFAPRVVMTDANGEWRAPLLAVGNYDITVTKDGFVGSKSQNVRVGLGASARVDLTMKPIAQTGALVEVVATGVSVDKAETTSGTNVSAEVLSVLPAADRSFGGAADLSPGLVTGSGGSYSIRGGATGNTQYRVNGTDVKDDYQGNLTGTFVIEDNIEDMQVILSPLNARNGRAIGGAINVVTKSGGNDFHGSIRATLSRPSWSAFQPGNVTTYPDRDNQVDDTLARNYQVTLSGPIVKDRVWFSVGTILTPDETSSHSLGQPYDSRANTVVQTRSASTNAVLNAGPTGYQWNTLDSGATYIRRDTSKYYEGKVTAAVFADHTLEFSFSKESVNLYNRNPYGDTGGSVGRLAALGHQNTEKSVYGLGYRGVLSSDTFVEARINRLDSASNFPPGDLTYGQGELLIVYAGQRGAAGTRRGLSYPFGLGQPPHPDKRPNRSANVNVKMFRDLLGANHEFDLGVDYYEGQRSTATQAGVPNLVYRVGGIYQKTAAITDPAAPEFLFPTVLWTGYGSTNAMDIFGMRGPAPTVAVYSSKDGLTKNKMTAFYANDQMTLNQHFNVMVGLRYENNKVIDTTGESLANANDFSPRFQVKYDLNGDSKHVFGFTAARYSGDFTTAFTDAFITQGSSNYLAYGWKGDGTQPLPGTAGDVNNARGVRFVTYAGLTDLTNYNTAAARYGANVRAQNIIDPNLSAPTMDEVTLSYRRTYGGGSFVALTGAHRVWKKDWAFKKDYLNSPAVLIPDSPVNVSPTYIFNSNDLKREYSSLEMEWNTRINSIWNVGGSWTYSHLTGNQEGGDAFGSTFRDNTPPSYFNNRAAKLGMGLTDEQIAPDGLLGNNITNRGRLHVEAILPLGKGTISYAAMLRYSSGRSYSQIVNDPYPAGTFTPMPAPSEQAPAQYTAFVNGRGRFEANNTYGVDFKVNFQVPLGISRMMLIGDISVNNLFNHSVTSGLDGTMWADAKYTLDQYPPLGYSLYNVKRNTVVINDNRFFNTTNTLGLLNQIRPDPNYFSAARSVLMSLGLKF